MGLHITGSQRRRKLALGGIGRQMRAVRGNTGAHLNLLAGQQRAELGRESGAAALDPLLAKRHPKRVHRAKA